MGSEAPARTLVAPGELRTDLLELFEGESTLDILLSAPGLLPHPPSGHARLASNPHEPLSASSAFAHRNALLEALGAGLDTLPQTADWEARIRTWIARLRERHARVLHYPTGPLFTQLISRADGSVIPAAPLTRALLERPPGAELDIVLSGLKHAQARDWFERHAAQSDDISAEVRALLEASWAGALSPAKDVYYKVLSEFFQEMLDGGELSDANPMLEVMTVFQKAAYQLAKSILRRFGGVFIADVVGLGKTHIAVALLHHLQDQLDQHAVVIAPPAVCPAWRDLAEEFKVNLRTVSYGKLDELEQYTQRQVLVIDESHNFRNPATRRYETIWKWLHPGGLPSKRKVLLLSATPQNNSSRDVMQQLRLFPDNFMRLPFPGESIEGFFKAVDLGKEALPTILQHVVVRRTRRFIQLQYPNAQLRVKQPSGEYAWTPIRFPTRISGADQCLRYRMEGTEAKAEGEGLYVRIISLLGQMEYPLYGLGGYILEMHAQDVRIVGFRQAGHSLRGLFKVLLLKRLESSEVAFRTTLERLRGRLQEGLENLSRGFVRVSEEVEDEEGGAAGEDMPAGMFHADRLRNALAADLARVEEIQSALAAQPLAAEAKLERLRAYLTARPPQKHRTLIFTQFSDTAEYLYERLKEGFGNVARVTGSSGNARKAARRFAPLANRAHDVQKSDEIDLLIATDALSEGVNLQDADTLINYDLHWNPVRLIQRAGRIDRLGSLNEEIHVASFLPERGLESNLGIEDVVRRRMQELMRVFGEDSHVLPSEEKIDLEGVLDAYAGRAFDKADRNDDMDGLGRHAERIFALKQNEPERFKSIRALRLGRRAATEAALPGVVATRMGWHWAFWRARGASVPPERMTELAGLDLLYRHANAPDVTGEDCVLDASTRLGQTVEDARLLFSTQARQVREQRHRPRLDVNEEWLRATLEAYGHKCDEQRRAQVEQMVGWILAGQYKTSLQLGAKRWRKEGLKEEALFQQMLGMLRYPVKNEVLGEDQLVGAVVGDRHAAADDTQLGTPHDSSLEKGSAGS